MAATDVSDDSNGLYDMRSFTQALFRNSPDLSVLTHSLVRKKYLAHTGRVSLGPDERRQLKKIVEDELLKVKVEDSDDDEPLSALVHSRKLASSCVQPLPTSTAVKEKMPFDSDCPDRQRSVNKSLQKKRKHQCSELEKNSDEEDSGMDQKKLPPRSALRRSSKKAANIEDSACKGEKYAKSGGGRNSSVEMERREVGNEEEVSEEEDSGLEKLPKAPESSSKCGRARKRMSVHNHKGRGAWRRSSSSSEEDAGVSINQKIKASTRSSSSEEDRRVSTNKKRKTAARNSSSSEEDRRESPNKKGETVRKSSDSSSSEVDEKESLNKKGETVRKSSGSGSSSSEEDEKESPNKKGETVRKSSVSGSSSSEEDEKESPNKKGKAASRSSSSEGEREKRARSSSCSEEDMGKSPNKGESMSSSEVDQGKQATNSSNEEVRKKRKKERSSSSTKEKKSGGSYEVQKGDSHQGSSLEDSDSASEEEEIQKNQRGKKEAKSGPANEKNSGKDEHPSIRRLKRCISACGVRRNYKKLFEGKSSVKAKVEVLKRELEDLGVNGNPTLEKCKIVRLEREEAAELASLDTSNIISSEGRLLRKNIWNSYQTPLDSSLGENYKRSVDSDEGEDPSKKKLMEWSNLKGIISDSGDSD